MEFGDRLKQRREEKKLTQEELGKGLNTGGEDAAKSVVSGWEKKKHFPRADQLALICKRLDISADYLLFGRMGQDDLSPEVSEMASAISALSPPRRAKIINTLREMIDVAQEADQLAKEKAEATARKERDEVNEYSSSQRGAR